MWHSSSGKTTIGSNNNQKIPCPCFFYFSCLGYLLLLETFSIHFTLHRIGCISMVGHRNITTLSFIYILYIWLLLFTLTFENNQYHSLIYWNRKSNCNQLSNPNRILFLLWQYNWFYCVWIWCSYINFSLFESQAMDTLFVTTIKYLNLLL